jgi:hypothetical protein
MVLVFFGGCSRVSTNLQSGFPVGNAAWQCMSIKRLATFLGHILFHDKALLKVLLLILFVIAAEAL